MASPARSIGIGTSRPAAWSVCRLAHSVPTHMPNAACLPNADPFWTARRTRPEVMTRPCR